MNLYVYFLLIIVLQYTVNTAKTIEELQKKYISKKSNKQIGFQQNKLRNLVNPKQTARGISNKQLSPQKSTSQKTSNDSLSDNRKEEKITESTINPLDLSEDQINQMLEEIFGGMDFDDSDDAFDF